MDDGSWLSFLWLFVLLICAFYFAAAETAFSSVSKTRLKARSDRGDRHAGQALKILDDFDKAITTILIGSNVVQISIATIATVLIARKWGVSAAAVSAVVVTAVLFFAGETLPKSIAKKYSERFSLAVAPSLCFFMKILSPVSYLLTLLGSAAARLTKGDSEVSVTEVELYDIIESMKDEGEIDAERGELVHSALLFADTTAEAILTARVDVSAIDASTPCEEILGYIKTQKHSRFPVFTGNIDNIIGVLQIRKFIRAYRRQGASLELQAILDEAFFVHRSAKVDELLPEMSRKKLNMAIVMDSYGGTLGIVTVEDILEELVGEIWDEDDDVVEHFVRLPDGRFEIDASLPVQDAFEEMDFSDPEGADFSNRLIGDWAYEQFGLLPREGDFFDYNGLRVTVSKMRQHRIMTLCAGPAPEPPAAERGERDK